MTEIVQESEMASIRLIFERAANAIVQASELSVAVKELSDRVNHLVSDIEYAQSKNRELDTMLHDTREQRDRALAEMNAARAQVHSQEMTINSLTQTNETQDKDIGYLQSELSKARDEAKGWEQAALKADAEAQQAKATLAKVQALFGGGEAKPEPETEQPKPAEPEPVKAPVKVVTQNDPDFTWDRSHHWDAALSTFVQD